MNEDKMVLAFIIWAVAVCAGTCVFLHSPTPFTLQVMEITLLSGVVFSAICILLVAVRKEFLK